MSEGDAVPVELEAIAHELFPASQLDSITRLPGGVSADVYRLDVTTQGSHSERIVVRVHGDTHDGHDAALEYKLLDVLFQGGLPVPEPLLTGHLSQEAAHPYIAIGFIDGQTTIPADKQNYHIDTMAEMLARVHGFDTRNLPLLPVRGDPLPELSEWMPDGGEWQALSEFLVSLKQTRFAGPSCLLHGDYWQENLIWQGGQIVGILDWEDAAIGDPLADVAGACVELRYLFGRPAMQAFVQAYQQYRPVDPDRLALWQIYVAAAALRFMGDWRLPAEREAHMRQEALASLREAGAVVMNQSGNESSIAGS